MMQKKRFSMMLMVVMAVFAIGCSGSNNDSEAASTQNAATTESVVSAENVGTTEGIVSTESIVATEDVVSTEMPGETEVNVLGEGSVIFPLTVVDKDGNETVFEIHTEKETVGEALLELELIAGEDGEYGLYVKTVNGITADYDTDGTYWAFYVNGEYAMSGVDTTAITEGDSYSFKVEK